MTYVGAMKFIRDEESLVIESIKTIQQKDVSTIADIIVNMFVGLYFGITHVVATRDSEKQSSNTELSQILTYLPNNIRPAQLRKLLRNYRERLDSAGWSKKQIDEV